MDRRTWLVAVAVSTAATGCGDDTSTTTDSTTATGSTAPTTATASSAGGTTTEVCETFGSIDTVSDGFPERLSTLVGADVRTGAHECFERIVLELQGEGEVPGYRVGYVDDPVRLSPSDQTVEIDGDATLVLSAGAWMTSMEGQGYTGPTNIVTTNVEHVLQLTMLENFEGMTAWAIGLDEQRPFVVDVLADPPRIVIDVATGVAD